MPTPQTDGSTRKKASNTKFKPPRPSNTAARGAVERAEENTKPSSADTSARIPSDLLTRLLNQFFEDERTGISGDASDLVGKYMDIFVKEALARAAIERKENNGGGDNFLEASTLTDPIPSWFTVLAPRSIQLWADGSLSSRLRTWRNWPRSCCSISDVRVPPFHFPLPAQEQCQ